MLIHILVIRIPAYNITVAPRREAEEHWEKYNTILSVSDCPTLERLGDIRYYWYPINEMSEWGYGPFYWSKKILDKHYREAVPILIHCDGGVCRSPMITVGWLYSIGNSREHIDRLMGTDAYTRDFERYQKEGRIPSNLFKMYWHMDEHPTYSMMGILGSMSSKYDSYREAH